MAYNTKAILVDVNGKPIPQYFDPITDEYKPLLGAHGASRSMLYGPDGNPISDTNKLPVRAADLETLIGALNDSAVTNPDAASASMLALLRGMLATFGKETTLAAVKAAAESLAQEDFATETTLAALLSAVGNLATEATLSGVKSAVDTLAGTVADGAQKVTLSGQTVQIGGVTFEFDPPRTIYGLAASRPTASAAHAVVPFAVYVSVDTKVIEQTDGSSWRRWGVA